MSFFIPDIKKHTMKTTLACLLVAVCLALVVAEKPYTNKFDNVDVDSVLGNNRILGNYIKCLMDKGPCTPEGRELKSKLVSFSVHNKKKKKSKLVIKTL